MFPNISELSAKGVIGDEIFSCILEIKGHTHFS